MTAARLRAQLEASKMPPVGALRLDDRQSDSLLPVLVEIMDKMAAGVFPLPREQHLLFHGLHVLAAARCQGIWRPLLRWLRSPCVDVDRILGYGYSAEILPRIALGVFDGDADPLIEAIEDKGLDGYLRWNLFDVFARLVFDGAVSRETALALIDRFDQERLADDEDAAWEGWQDVVQLLGIEERADRVRASWEDGRNPQQAVDRQDWEDELQRALAEFEDPYRFVEQKIEPLEDAVTALQAVYEQVEVAEEPLATRDKGLRKDPAAKIALSDEELDWLDGFLTSAQAPPTTMELETLDGFFTALIVGPEPIPPSFYLPAVWGGDGEGPTYDGMEQAEYVVSLLMRHWNTIAKRLECSYPSMPLLARGTAWREGRRWAEGFTQGIGLCFGAWEPLMDDEQLAQLLAPIIALESDDHELFDQPAGLEDRKKMLSATLLAVHGLYVYWREDGAGGIAATRKIGRNEPCPCGSGKKYKRCCSAVDATIH